MWVGGGFMGWMGIGEKHNKLIRVEWCWAGREKDNIINGNINNGWWMVIIWERIKKRGVGKEKKDK